MRKHSINFSLYEKSDNSVSFYLSLRMIEYGYHYRNRNQKKAQVIDNLQDFFLSLIVFTNRSLIYDMLSRP